MNGETKLRTGEDATELYLLHFANLLTCLMQVCESKPCPGQIMRHGMEGLDLIRP